MFQFQEVCLDSDLCVLFGCMNLFDSLAYLFHKDLTIIIRSDLTYTWLLGWIPFCLQGCLNSFLKRKKILFSDLVSC